MQARQWGLGYRPELDGLRAISVLFVMMYHFKVAGFGDSGPLGVRVFFTLSGFLITALLLEEHSRGPIDLPAFWRRRFVRLLPALAPVLALPMMFNITPTRPTMRALGGILHYAANWLHLGDVQIQPFVHMWSLAVEEQFYLAWPIALMALLKTRTERQLIRPIMIAMAASTGLRVVWWVTAENDRAAWDRVYFGTDTNLVFLLAGAALAAAFRSGIKLKVPGWLAALSAATLVALAGIPALISGTVGAAMMRIEVRAFVLPFVGLAAILVLLAWMDSHSTGVLAWRPLVWTGRISYGLYLWHWVIASIAIRAGHPMEGEAVTTAVLTAATFGAAYVSWVLVERPAMRWKAPRRPGGGDVLVRRLAATPAAPSTSAEM